MANAPLFHVDLWQQGVLCRLGGGRQESASLRSEKSEALEKMLSFEERTKRAWWTELGNLRKEQGQTPLEKESNSMSYDSQLLLKLLENIPKQF